MTFSLIRCFSALVLGLQAFQLLRGANLPLDRWAQLLDDDVRHATDLYGMLQESHSQALAAVSAAATANRHGLLFNSGIVENAHMTDGLSSDTAYFRLRPGQEALTHSPQSASPPPLPQRSMASSSSSPPDLTNVPTQRASTPQEGEEGFTASHSLSNIVASFPELSVAQRRATLEQLREEIYHLTLTKILLVKSMEPVLVPYDNHLTIAGFEVIVSQLASFKKPPWLYTSFRAPSQRFLLRQAWPNSDTFRIVNGFKAGDHNRIFFEAWQEMGEHGSEVFQYLGVFRVPHRGRMSFYKETILDKSFYHIQQYRVLSPSTFTTKRLGTPHTENTQL